MLASTIMELVALPSSGLQADLLIGAGCVATVEAAAITMGEFGGAPCFNRAIKAGTISMLDATCPALHSGFQAAQKGAPFLPMRGLIGTDILANRPDWRVIDNPFADGGDPVVLLPAIQPDVAMFHAPLADRDGNVWIGVRRELVTMAHAAKSTLVTVERVQEESLLDDPKMAAATLPSIYVDAIAEAEKGAWPIRLWNTYDLDGEHLRTYVDMARSEEGFAEYLATHVTATEQAAE